jgi:hypothetical protein
MVVMSEFAAAQTREIGLCMIGAGASSWWLIRRIANPACSVFQAVLSSACSRVPLATRWRIVDAAAASAASAGATCTSVRPSRDMRMIFAALSERAAADVAKHLNLQRRFAPYQGLSRTPYLQHST